jgi:hypothetical protein
MVFLLDSVAAATGARHPSPQARASMDNGRPLNGQLHGQAVMIDIDREREHWRQRYQDLPRARALRSFARYWPLLCAVYDVYLIHPRAPRGDALRLYLQRGDVAASLLRENEAVAVFDRAWSRIEAAAARAADPG